MFSMRAKSPVNNENEPEIVKTYFQRKSER